MTEDRPRAIKYTYVVLGLLCVGLGAIGAIVPGLPTTVFLIMAAYLFSKSNPRLYNWVITNKYFGRHVKEYLDNPSIPLRIKILAISMMTIMVAYSSIFLIELVWLKILVVALGLIGFWYVGFHIPTRKEEREP